VFAAWRRLVLVVAALLAVTPTSALAQAWNTPVKPFEEQQREALEKACQAFARLCRPPSITPAPPAAAATASSPPSVAPAPVQPHVTPPAPPTPASPAITAPGSPPPAPPAVKPPATLEVTTSPPPETQPPAPGTGAAPEQTVGAPPSAPAAPVRETGEPAPERAAQLQPRDFSFAVASRAWISSGFTHWSFGADRINVLSSLNYRGVDAVIPEVQAEVMWKRFVLMGSYGWSGIDQGVLIDDDFDLPDRQGRFSHTRSHVDDQRLYYINGDVGFRLASFSTPGNPAPGFADVLVGYQYWHEKYVAFGATGFFDIPPIVDNVAPPDLKVLTRDYTWQSLRVGFRYHVPGPAGFGFKGRVLFNPWTYSEMSDVHHLRDDLKKNPSVFAKAEGGFGTQIDFGLTYTPWRWLTLEAGFQYWHINPGSGDAFIRTLSSGTFKDKLNEQKIERYGPYFQLQGRF
jgi:outer membrane protease